MRDCHRIEGGLKRPPFLFMGNNIKPVFFRIVFEKVSQQKILLAHMSFQLAFLPATVSYVFV